MLTSMNVGDEYYEVKFTKPLNDREVVKVARALDVNLDGVCMVVVSFVREPLTAKVLSTKDYLPSREALDDQQRIFDCDDVDHL